MAPDKLNGVENSVVGLLSTMRSYPKVIRWALNTIAQIGRAEFSLTAVQDMFSKLDGQPDLQAAAISALFKLRSDAYSYLKALKNVEQDLLVLSALQVSQSRDIPVNETRIDIDKASPSILKSTLITLGLNKAPANIFHPTYENSEVVGHLNHHDNKIVSQYSVWATAENPYLGAKDLRIPASDFGGLPENVRSWVYRLIASENNNLAHHHDLIVDCSRDKSEKARSGLITGLYDNYYDGLDVLICDWFSEESDEDVRELLLGHMASQNQNSATYFNYVSEMYDTGSLSARCKARITAAASRTKLFSKLKQIEYSSGPSLFEGTNNIFIGEINMGDKITTGDIQGGAVNIGSGSATNSGKLESLTQKQTLEAQKYFTKALAELNLLDSEITERGQAIDAVEKAKTKPSKKTITSAADSIFKVVKRINDVAKLSASAKALTAIGGGLMGLF